MKFTEELKKTLDKDIIDFIEECRDKQNNESYLISILHKVQARYGYLSDHHMQEVAEYLGIPAAKVSGVATFYHFFRLTPQGKYKISVCLGTACYVKGANEVLEAFKFTLRINEGETTKDGLYSIENTRCLGVCGLAPVVTINDKVYGKVTPEMVPSILRNLREEEKALAE